MPTRRGGVTHLPIIRIQDIPTAVLGAAITALGLGRIAVIEGQLFPGVDITEGDNPDGGRARFV
jgi:hypothetical protein